MVLEAEGLPIDEFNSLQKVGNVARRDPSKKEGEQYRLSMDFNPRAYEKDVLARVGVAMDEWIPAQYQWKRKFFDGKYMELLEKDGVFQKQIFYAFEKSYLIPYITKGTSAARQLSELWNYLNDPNRFPMTEEEFCRRAVKVLKACKILFPSELKKRLKISDDDILRGLLEAYSDYRVYTGQYYQKKGVKTLFLYRGFYSEDDSLRNKFIAGKTISRGSFEAWTPQYEVAKKFADNWKRGFVVRKDIPIKDIVVSCDLFPEFSVKGEKEFLVDASYSIVASDIVYEKKAGK